MTPDRGGEECRGQLDYSWRPPLTEKLAYVHLPGSAGVELRPGERLVIGRSEGCHIRIQSSRVSRQHAELHWDVIKPVPFVVDMGSQNGSRLDDKELVAYHPHPLRDGASIRIADHRLRVELFLPEDTELYLNDKKTGVSVFWDNNEVAIAGTLGVDVALREVFEKIEAGRLSGTLTVDHDGELTQAVFCLGRLFDARSPRATGTEAILNLRKAAGGKVAFSPEFEPTSKSFDLRATEVLAGKHSPRGSRGDPQTERWDRVE